MTATPLLLLALLLPAVFALVCADPEARDDPPALGLAVGEAHPDFVLPDLDGGAGRLSDLRGKRLLLFHFASW